MLGKKISLELAIGLISIFFPIVSYSYSYFPLPPRFTGNGYASDYAVGQADVMLPLRGDRAHNLYIDPSIGLGSGGQGYADLGVGYRWIHNAAAILGGYVFGGYSHLDNNARIWVLNPGIEALGSRWDGHINAYFPMGDRNYALSNYQALGFFTGHSQFNNLYQLTQNDGPGLDAIAGYQIFPGSPLKAYAGAYAFAPNGGSIVGGALAAEYWLQQYLKVFAAYTYDNVRHSTGAFGVGVEFGGTHIHRSDPSLEERITDPIQRYIAELGRGSKIPTRNKTTVSAPFAALNNIAFFSQSGTPNNGGTGLTITNCTFENPCGPTDLTDAATGTLAGLLPNTTIVLEGGGYAAVNVPGGTTGVTIQTGQSIVGNGSTLNGALNLSGDNSITGVILLPTAGTAGGIGVTAGAGGSISITDSQIGSPGNPFNTGVSITGSTQATITGSTISSTTTGMSSTNTNLTVNGGTNVNVSGTIPVGIIANGGGSLNVGAGTTVTVVGSGPSIGIGLSGGSSATVDVTGTTVTATSSTGAAVGIDQVAGSTGGLTVSGGTVVATGGDGSTGIGLNGSGNTTISGGTSVTVTGGNNTIGIGGNAGGTVTIGGGTSVTVTGGTGATGISSSGSGSTTVGTGTSVTVTGGTGSSGIHCTGSGGIEIIGGNIHVIGGAGSAGLILNGSGLIQLLGGTIVTVEGGINTVYGILTTAANNIIIDGLSALNVIGGALSEGIHATGGGAINLRGGSLINVTGGVNNAIGGINLLLGSTANLLVGGGAGIHVTGGDGSFGITTLSTGAVAVTEASIVEVLGGLNTLGISAIGTGAVELAGASQVLVTGGPGSFGLNVATAAGLNIIGGSLIKVVGTGIGPIIGVNALSLGAVTGEQVSINVTNNNPSGLAIGLVTNGTATIGINDVAVTVLGNNTSLISNALGGAITLTNCTAILNGVVQPLC